MADCLIVMPHGLFCGHVNNVAVCPLVLFDVEFELDRNVTCTRQFATVLKTSTNRSSEEIVES